MASYAPAVVRGAYGLLLCVAPDSLIRLASGSAGSPRARAVARVLGARHLAQAALAAVRPNQALLTLGAEVDVLHSASMLALGGVNAQPRRIALTDGVVAAAFAAGGIAAARRVTARSAARPDAGLPDGFTRRRNAAADRLAVLAVPPAVRRWLTGAG